MLYNVESPVNSARSAIGQAGSSYGAMMPNIPEPEEPEPTAGGAMMAGAGGGMLGAQVGSMMASEAAIEAGGIAAIGGPIPLIAGIGFGAAAYFLS